MNKEEIIMRFPRFVQAGLAIIARLPFINRKQISGKNNKISGKNNLRFKCKINIKGNNNTITFADWSRCINTRFVISGNNCHISIGERAYSNEGVFFIEDDNGSIIIGNGTCISGRTHLASIEGCKITIGNDCLFSSGVYIRTGDSHSLLSMQGERINHSKNVTLKDRIWVGHNATILKGVTIENDSVVGTGTIVTNAISQSNVVICGIPGKIIKSGVKWISERI